MQIGEQHVGAHWLLKFEQKNLLVKIKLKIFLKISFLKFLPTLQNFQCLPS